ncbi:MAG: lyase domain protein repeat-containing protein [Myxococcales bacterium]|nr:lyase domain protein repeat-containing protein [Myxococcales bacterium]
MLGTILFLSLAVAPEAPQMTDAQLDQIIQPIRSGDPSRRKAAALEVATLGPEAYSALVQRLAKPKQSKPEVFRKLFLEMWAQVPNWKGPDPMWIRKPEPPWTAPPRVKGQPRAKRPPPHDPETTDWLAALESVDLAKAAELDTDKLIPVAPLPKGAKRPTPPAAPPMVVPASGQPAIPAGPVLPSAAELETARAEAVETVAIIRALAASKRLDAVDPIFKLAFENDGVFRDECGRVIRSMDSYAVPTLVRLLNTPSTREKPFAKQKRYASYQLDRMDRQRPQKAISTAPDDRVRADIIHAYGEARALDAVEAVLNQVDSPAHRVRREARWAWLRYVSGKAPPPAPKRKRKLPGGRAETEEKPDYLTYREIATLALQKQLQAINNEPPDANATAKQMTDELFEYYDKKRAAEWDAELAAAKVKEERGDVKGAVDEYGWILSHDPNHPRRGEMAHAFAKYGDSLKDQGEIGRALGYWRQAIDLAPEGPDARAATARVTLYDATEALKKGHADVGAFKRAMALDPSLTEARSGLARAQSLHARRRWLSGAEALLAALAIALGLWLLWRRTTVPPTTTS